MIRLACFLLVCGSAIATASDADDLQSSDEATRLKTAKRLSMPKPIDPALTGVLVDRMREDPSPPVRRAAAFALGNAQPPQRLALAALVEVVSDPDELGGIRQGAAESLGKLAKDSKRAAVALEKAAASDPAVTVAAVQALVAIGAEDKAKGLLEHRDEKIRSLASIGYLRTGGGDVLSLGLFSPDAAIRKQAIGTVFSRPKVRNTWKDAEIAALQKAVSHTDPDVRFAVTRALYELHETAPVIAALVEGLGSANENVQWISAEALGVAGAGVAKHLPELIAALDATKNDRMKLGLIRALGEAREKAKPALPKLFAFLKDDKPPVRRITIEALGKAGVADPAETLKQVKPYANDPDPATRAAVVTTIASLNSNSGEIAAQLRSKDAATIFAALASVKRLDDGASLVPDLIDVIPRIPPPRPGFGKETTKVSDALASIGHKAVPGILEGLKSTDPVVREVCGDALKLMKLDAVPAVPELRKGVASTEAHIRRACAVALGNCGHYARPAIPDLVKAMETYEDTSEVVGDALAWIGGVTGDDAKKLVELARAPGKPVVRYGRIVALGGMGEDARPILAELDKGFGPNDRHPKAGVKAALLHIDPVFALGEQLKQIDSAQTPQEAGFRAIGIAQTANHKGLVASHLVKRLGDTKGYSLAEVVRCLGWLGPDAAFYLPEIEPLTSSQDEGLRIAAKRAIKQIKP